jgi:hypothetical protein
MPVTMFDPNGRDTGLFRQPDGSLSLTRVLLPRSWDAVRETGSV